jgi:hypothetical protein
VTFLIDSNISQSIKHGLQNNVTLTPPFTLCLLHCCKSGNRLERGGLRFGLKKMDLAFQGLIFAGFTVRGHFSGFCGFHSKKQNPTSIQNPRNKSNCANKPNGKQEEEQQ